MMFPKEKRVKDRATVDRVRAIDRCEKCDARRGLEVHHIKSRGSWGGDMVENMILLCFVCHRKVHDGNISRKELREIVAGRMEGRNGFERS